MAKILKIGSYFFGGIYALEFLVGNAQAAFFFLGISGLAALQAIAEKKGE